MCGPPGWSGGCTVRRTDPKLRRRRGRSNIGVGFAITNQGRRFEKVGRSRVSSEFSEFDAKLVEGLGE